MHRVSIMSSSELEKSQAKFVSEEEIDKWQEADEKSDPEQEDQHHTDLERKYADTQLRVVRTTMDFTLHNLRTNLEDSKYINLSPGYQRRLRWSIKQRSQLIESLLLNIPIPPVFLFEMEYNRYEVMDGIQRLASIGDFLNNQYKLKGLDYWQELDGYKFKELPDTIQRGLLRRTISTVTLLAESMKSTDSDNIDVRAVLFKRLNTGGAQLNPQEIRNSLYLGNFNKLLHKLSRDDFFCESWGIPKKSPGEEETPPDRLLRNPLYKTMADCELVLRFFAIRETIENDLHGSLKKLLDKSMQAHQKDNKESLNENEVLFKSCISKLFHLFDGDPFTLLSKKVSKPLYDALMVALSFKPDADLESYKEEIEKRLDAALTDDDRYEVLVGRGNTVSAIKERVLLARQILRI